MKTITMLKASIRKAKKDDAKKVLSHLEAAIKILDEMHKDSAYKFNEGLIYDIAIVNTLIHNYYNLK